MPPRPALLPLRHSGPAPAYRAPAPSLCPVPTCDACDLQRSAFLGQTFLGLHSASPQRKALAPHPPHPDPRYDLLHHTADSQRLFPAASFARPPYVAPAPAAPAEKKEGKGDNGKADGKAAGKGSDKAAPAASVSGEKKGKGAGKEEAVAAGGDAAAAPGGKKDKGKGKAGKGAAPATPAASGEAAPKKDDDCTVDLLDIRVGQIVKVGPSSAASGRAIGAAPQGGQEAWRLPGEPQQA